MEYSILTPVAPHKLYATDLYWNGVENLTQKPTKIFIHAKQDVFFHWMNQQEKPNVIWDAEPEDAKTRIVPGTTASRESLRKAFLEKGETDWALWLDCDIIPSPDMIDKFEAFLKEHPDLVMLVAYHPSRSNISKVRHGISCTFAHRDAMMAYPFTIATLRGHHLGDDQIWLYIIRQFSRRKGVETLSGLYFDVKHAHEDGRIKEFDENTKNRIILK